MRHWQQITKDKIFEKNSLLDARTEKQLLSNYIHKTGNYTCSVAYQTTQNKAYILYTYTDICAWCKSKQPTWMNRPYIDKWYSLERGKYLLIQEIDFEL